MVDDLLVWAKIHYILCNLVRERCPPDQILDHLYICFYHLTECDLTCHTVMCDDEMGKCVCVDSLPRP